MSYRKKDKLLVRRAKKIQKFLTQLFLPRTYASGIPGRPMFHLRARKWKGLRNYSGRSDHLPEEAFYMVGSLKEV